MAKKPTVLIAACDHFLAGVYGRKFEREGWDVEIVEDMKEAEHRAVLLRPTVLMMESDCVVDVPTEVKRLKTLPTMLKTHIVVLAHHATQDLIQRSLNAGAIDYLLVGHFVPMEAVAKLKRLSEV